MLNGRPLRRLSTAQLAAEIGYLAQDPAAYFLCTSVAEEIRRHDERLGSARDEAWLQWLRTLFWRKLGRRAIPTISPAVSSSGWRCISC